jgi:Putative zinc-finger
MSRPACAEVELLLPELALGTLSGEERARALEHLSSCHRCSDELRKLNELGDELLLLAPSAEPPVGFESLVVDRLGVDSRKRRRRKGTLVAAAAVLLVLLSTTATYFVGGGDRELADSYRETLKIANGKYVAAHPLTDQSGVRAGYIFGYQGSPSWIFCVVSSRRSTKTYEIEVSSEDGRSWELGETHVNQSEATWGGSLPIPLHDVEEIKLVTQSGEETLVANWSDDE